MIAQEVYEKIKVILQINGEDCENIVLRNNDIDYSITLYKNIIFKIVPIKTFLFLCSKSKYKYLFIEKNIKITYLDDNGEWIKYKIENINDISKISDIIIDIYEDFEASVHQFGCCSRYEECSNNKKCIHPDTLYSQGCLYRKNLESGKIFYGINANQHIKQDEPQIKDKKINTIDDKKSNEQLSFI